MTSNGAVAVFRILLVDDDRDLANSLAMLLRLEGHEVEVANDGPSALAAMSRELPHVAIVDIAMPGMNGYEVARRVRADAGLKDVFLVSLSGWSLEEDRLLSAQAGFNHHFIKPVRLADLEGILARAAGRVRRPDVEEF
jgi:CheY-like chemotaxis protein